jgi:hypothetical protein
MTDPTIIGTDSDIIWGTEGCYEGTIMSCRKLSAGDKREIKNNNGNVATKVFFNERTELEVEVLAQASVEIPARGDDVTIAAITGQVDEVEENWANEKEKSFKVKATFNPDCVAAP